jgi:hypothetical protein
MVLPFAFEHFGGNTPSAMFEKNKVDRVGDRRRRRGFRNVILIVRDEDSVFGEGALRWLVGWLRLGIAAMR